MRWSFKALIVVVMGLMALDLAIGQQPFQIPGIMGKGGAKNDPINLLHNASVKKELRMTDDQAGKVDDAVWKALAEVLNPEQLKRLRQIELQQMDYMAFADSKVQASLKMTDEQREDIATILKDAEKTAAELGGALFGGKGGGKGKGGGDKGGAPGGGGDKFQSFKDDIREKCTSTLTAPQKRLWLEMIGEEFKLENPVFDFGNKKGGGKKKG
jgi:hypothetical protein